jgi:catechol 2,3-dioxygenase-like lactoylglutathione lyase family enzyme
MTPPVRPEVECERLHVVLEVSDVPAAIAFYCERLGFTEGFRWGEPVTFAGVTLGEVQVFLQQGTPNPLGFHASFVVGDADALLAFQSAQGVEVAEPIGDRAYGLRDYAVRDLHGHLLVFGHYIYTTGPAMPIERVDVPVRLEKRLAAVLTDLAADKRMSVSSCLEETLLHTFEPLGDGVASPHTAAQLRRIQELKQKHGIDYDCHASYRFVEEGEA